MCGIQNFDETFIFFFIDGGVGGAVLQTDNFLRVKIVSWAVSYIPQRSDSLGYIQKILLRVHTRLPLKCSHCHSDWII